MGNWNINIQGVGCHHNNNPEIDADLATEAFVALLKKQGHTIENASFTYGGKIDSLAKAIEVKDVHVNLNGKTVILKNDASYEDIIAAYAAQTNQDVEKLLPLNLTVVYYRGRNKSEGILSHGKKADLQNGSLIDVANTSNA